MRVAHVITRMILGGAQENTLLNCVDLIRLYGDDVLLVTGPAIGPEGTLLDQAREAGVPIALVPSLRRAIHPTRDFTTYFALKRIIKDFRPDVVHTHSAKGGILGRNAAAAAPVPAIIHTVHGAPFYPYQNIAVRNFYRWCEKQAATRCHRIISVADAMTDLMVDAGVAPREKFRTIYSGMEVEPFLHADEHRDRMRANLGLERDHVAIGKIARLFHLKGHADVIAAAERVVRECPQARFVFIGDGLLRADLEAAVRRRGLESYFRFVGLVPATEIPPLLGAMDLLVHASLREGLARALPQALIAGKPAVSYDVDGAREVVLPGRTGVLVPARDVEGLAQGMIDLARDAELRQCLGGQGRGLFAERFRHERMTEEIRKVYLEVLQS